VSNIELTAAQAKALASLAEREGPLALHQLASAEATIRTADDIYATPRGSSKGYKIAADGEVAEIGETLPAPE
jgi:hypothetical protein